MEADPRLPEGVFARGKAMAWLSAGWDGTEAHDTARRWLLGALPENGTLPAWMGEAEARFRALGVAGDIRRPESLLWVYRSAEFPGALQVLREGERAAKPLPVASSAYQSLSETDVGEMLSKVVRTALALKGRPEVAPERARSSLSGVRPKVSLTAAGDGLGGGWLQGQTGQLNTWIVKVENDMELPGEAGVESLCQRALALAGMPASRTLARVVDGRQCVLSERSDRRMEGGCVLAAHQEEFRQACDAGTERFPAGLGREAEWPAAYRLLGRASADPDGEADRLTRLLAASAMICHADLHRGNLGYRVSAPGDGPKRVSLAPAYDVSTAIGTKLSKDLTFGIAGQRSPAEIGAPQWKAHAARCGIDAERTLAAVAEVAAALPEAFAQARIEASAEDVNADQAAVDRRAERTLAYLENRRADFERCMRGRSRPATPGPGG